MGNRLIVVVENLRRNRVRLPCLLPARYHTNDGPQLLKVSGVLAASRVVINVVGLGT